MHIIVIAPEGHVLTPLVRSLVPAILDTVEMALIVSVSTAQILSLRQWNTDEYFYPKPGAIKDLPPACNYDQKTQNKYEV